MWRRICVGLAVLVLLIFCAPVHEALADQVLSADGFTQSYAARAKMLFPAAKVTVTGDLEVKIKMDPGADGEGFTSYLDNAYKMYLEEPARLEEITDRHIRVLAEDLSQASVAKREQLVAVVRRKGFLDELKAKQTDQSFPEKQLAGDIYVFYAFDAPNTVHYADSRTIGELGVAEPDLDAVAIENLPRVMAEPLIETYPEMVAISANDPYLTSLLLIDRFWAKDRFRFRGDLVVFVVARDLMLVTGSEETAGLAAAREAVQQLVGQVPYAISTDPIVRRGDAWQSFVQ